MLLYTNIEITRVLSILVVTIIQILSIYYEISYLWMNTPHGESKHVALIQVGPQLLQSESRLGLTPQFPDFVEEVIVVQLEQLFKVILSLLWRSARTEEVSQFESGSAESRVLEIDNHYVKGICSVLIGVPEINQLWVGVITDSVKKMCWIVSAVKYYWFVYESESTLYVS